MDQTNERRRAVAAELTYTWGPGEKYRSIRRISLDVCSAQAELIDALQRESRELELRILSTELERDTNQDRIDKLQGELASESLDRESADVATDEK